jgi:chromosome segregation ATPase
MRKNDALGKRESKLSEQERRIDEKMRKVEKLNIDVSNFEKTRQEVTALIEEKKRVLEELKSAITSNNQTIKELHEKTSKARVAERELSILQRENAKKLKLMEAKEQEMIRREAAWLEHEKALKEAASALANDKKELQDEVNSRKAEMLLVQQEWEKKLSALAQEKEDLKREKADVRQLVESDVLALKEKEDEMVEAIAMLERDRARLQAEEKSLLKKVAELERAKSELEREQKVLSSKEKRVVDGERIIAKGMKYLETEKRKLESEKDAVYRARELKRLLPKMEKRYEELRRGIRRYEAKTIGKAVEPSRSRLLEERESMIAEREKGVELEVRKLMEREHEVEALESRKERAFSEYLREEVERARMGKPGREIMNPEIHGMIDDAREKVMQGKLDEAVRLVAEAEYLVDKIANPNQKRAFIYDLRDLKASIKLASLT